MKQGSSLIRRFLPVALLVLILLFGAYLRLYKIPEYMTFLGDEGRDMIVIKRMIVDHKFTLLGPTASVGGFFLGPVYYYFMVPFVWLFHMDPSGAAVMVALFGVATIYLLYRMGKEWFSEEVGLMASALYALSPVVIAYSRSSWNPNLVPFFSTLMMYLIWKSVRDNRQGYLFWAGIALGIGLQLHYLFLFLIPVVGMWLLVFARNKEWLRGYALGIVGCIVGYGPFLLFELRHGFPNSIAIYRFLQEGQGTGFDIEIFWKNVTDVSFRIFGRLVYRLPPPEQLMSMTERIRSVWINGTLAGLFSSVLLAVLSVAQFRNNSGKEKSKRQHEHSARVLLLFWFMIPVLLFGLYKKGIYDYYFGIVFVVPFLFTALLLRKLSRTVIGLILGSLICAGLLWLNWEGRPFKFPPNNQLRQARTIAEAAIEKTDGKPFNFALLANFNSDHAYRYFFEMWGRAPLEIQNTDTDPHRKSVTDQLIIICELPECKPLGHPLWEIAGFGRAEIIGEWNVSFVKIMRLVHYREDIK